MKRTITNVFLWLLVVALLMVLFFTMYPGRVEQLKRKFMPTVTTLEPQATAVPLQVSELMKEKQHIEKQLFELKQEMQAIETAPMTVMLLFSTINETMIREAGDLLDQCGLTALLGVSDATLQQWIDAGVPGYINERLNAGWEFCFILGDESVALMQNRLKELNLPSAIAGYMLDNLVTNDAEHLLGNGVNIVLDDGIRVHSSDDGLWHVPAVGSMNSSGLSIYESKKNTGEAIVYVLGDLRGDQRYIKINLEGLLAMIVEDCKTGMSQNLKLQPAMSFCRNHAEKVAQYQASWDQRERELQNQLTEVLQKLGSAGQ